MNSIIFSLVGATGFLVDVAVLYSIKDFTGLFYGRAVSFLTAVLATWLMNRIWTFKQRSSGLSIGREFAVYLALMLVGGTVNYAVYVWLVVSYELAHQYPVFGVACGSFAGLFVNFSTSFFVLFQFVDPKKERI